jgi:hypothetical protein
MKTRLLILALIASVFASQIQGQNRTIVNAMNSEISDNLDLRVVASIFGDSRNLQDFERRLNDPKLQISNLDLNNDGQVDYLRVIESVHRRTHIVILQSVLNPDLYQDVATIEIEKTWNNTIRIQVVGNSYFYGPNYIYEPVYCYSPIIYANFWMPNYRPYFSNWSWNFYPSYFYAWNTYPLFRYRNNVNICLNNYYYNNFNYVNNHRSSYLSTVHNNRRANGYERQYPNNSFSQRNTAVSNRYELDQVRNSRNSSARNAIGYSPNSIENSRVNNTRRTDSRNDYSQNRLEITRESTTQRDYSQNRVDTPRQAEPQRDYSQNRVETRRESAPQRDYSQNRVETPREAAPQREYSQNRVETPREAAPQREYSQNRVETRRESAAQRDYSQNRVETPRESAPQREYSQNRVETRRESAPQRVESAQENNSSRNSSSNGDRSYSRNGGR